MVVGRALGMECDAGSAEGQPHAGNLAGAHGSRLSDDLAQSSSLTHLPLPHAK